MSNKTTFEFNSTSINNGLQKVIKVIEKSRFKVSSKEGRNYMNIPLVAAVVLALVIPFIVIFAVILVVCSVIQISIERDVQIPNDVKKVIELK